MIHNHPHERAIGRVSVLEWPVCPVSGSPLAQHADGEAASESMELKTGHVVVAALFILAAVIVNLLPN